MAAGGAAWAICGLIAGLIEEGANSRLELAGSFAFQVGLLCLVAAAWATQAAGAGRWGRAVLSVQAVLVLLATGWTLPHLFEPNMDDQGIILALDAALPLSMLWLIVQGVAVARARRWTGSLRWAPLVGSLWFPVAILASGAGEWPALVVSSLLLFVTYVGLGVLLVRSTATEHSLEPRRRAASLPGTGAAVQGGAATRRTPLGITTVDPTGPGSGQRSRRTRFRARRRSPLWAAMTIAAGVAATSSVPSSVWAESPPAGGADPSGTIRFVEVVSGSYPQKRTTPRRSTGCSASRGRAGSTEHG